MSNGDTDDTNRTQSQLSSDTRKGIEAAVQPEGSRFTRLLETELENASERTPAKAAGVTIGRHYIEELVLNPSPSIEEFSITCQSEDIHKVELTNLLVSVQSIVLEDLNSADQQINKKTVRQHISRDIAWISSEYTKQNLSQPIENGPGQSEKESHVDVELIKKKLEEINNSIQEIDFLADQQADNMTEINDEIGGISAAIEEIAVSAETINERSDRASDLTTEGEKIAQKLNNRMVQVNDNAESVANAIQKLESEVKTINEFTKSIDKIADQTDMLALNASIEAARVDEGGDGFAVVADEVKSLAQESKQKAKEIEELVESVNIAVSEVTADMNNVCEEAENGVDIAADTLNTFEDISQLINELSGSIDEIATGTSRQSESTEEIAMMTDEASNKADMISTEMSDIAGLSQEAIDQTE